MLIATLFAGCAQAQASNTEPAKVEETPKPTPTPTPEPTPTPTPEPVILAEMQVLLDLEESELLELLQGIEIPLAYEVYEMGEDEIGFEELPFTLYSYEDIEGNMQYRAFGFRFDPKAQKNIDIGFYEIGVLKMEQQDGKTLLTLMFDAETAMPVDLEKEIETYKEAVQKKIAKAKADKEAAAKAEADKAAADKAKADKEKSVETKPVQTPKPGTGGGTGGSGGGSDNGGGNNGGGGNTPNPTPKPEPPTQQKPDPAPAPEKPKVEDPPANIPPREPQEPIYAPMPEPGTIGGINPNPGEMGVPVPENPIISYPEPGTF